MEKYTLLVILVIALIGVGAYVFVNLGGVGGDTIVSAQGVSEIEHDPELVSVYISIETLADSADKAKNENARIHNDVATALVLVGLERESIQTQNFNVYEEFDWTEHGRKSKGWKVVNSLIVTVEDFEKIGGIVDAAVDNGGLVQTIQFELTQETQNELKARALEAASADARVKAEALARGSGQKLGSLVTISSNDFNYYPYSAFAMAEGTSADEVRDAATTITPRELTVRASVHATYKLR